MSVLCRQKSRQKILLWAVFLGGFAFFIRTGFAPESFLEAPASRDHNYWYDFWSSEDYPVNISMPGDELPTVFPGPLDIWGGGESRSIVVDFELPPGEYTLELLNFDSHGGSPPVLDFSLNAQQLKKVQISPGAGSPPPYEMSRSKLAVRFPLNITAEDNTLVIESAAGSWLAPAALRIVGEEKFSPLNFNLRFGFLFFLACCIFLAARRPNRIYFKIGLCVFTGISLYFMYSSFRESLVPVNADGERARYLFTGDEPSYMLLSKAISMGDWIDVRRAHGTDRQYYTLDCYRGLGIEQWIDRSSYWRGKHIPNRAPLLPLIISPLHIFRDYDIHWHPRWEAMLMMNLIAALSACLVFWLMAHRKLFRFQLLQSAVLILCLGAVPIAYYTVQIFPEALVGCILLVSLSLLSSGMKRNTIIACILLFIALWGTQRVFLGVLFAIALLFFFFLKKKSYGMASLLVCGLVLYFFYHFYFWGLPFIPNINPASRMTPGLLPLGLARFWLSREIGLLFFSPASFAGLLAGGWLLIKGRELIDLVWAVMLLGLVLLVACFPDYRAGVCPAGRYQVMTAYIMVFPLIRLISRESGGQDRLLPPFVLSSIVLGAAGFMISFSLRGFPNFWFKRYHPLFAFPSIRPYYEYLPAVGEAGWQLKAFLWILAFALLTALLEYASVWINKRLSAQRRKEIHER